MSETIIDYSDELRRLVDRTFLQGTWNERSWLNIPGTFYGAVTDTCMAGPSRAPHNVLLTEEGQEFVYRQPSSADQFLAVLWAAYCDPCSGYGADGNSHWTVKEVRNWWRNRHSVHTWIDKARDLYMELYYASLPGVTEVLLNGLREFDTYLRDLRGARHYLAQYAFLIESGRVPGADAKLPGID